MPQIKYEKVRVLDISQELLDAIKLVIQNVPEIRLRVIEAIEQKYADYDHPDDLERITVI